MTETSYYWDGSSTGDASLAPYGEDEFMALLLRSLFIQWLDTQGPIDGYSDMLEVAVSAAKATVSPGAALVYGFVYISDDDEEFAIATGNYYRVVLRVSWAAKTVRLVLLSNAGSLPALTQTAGTTWEINLADIDYSGGAPSLTDRRVFVRPNGYRYPRVAAVGSKLASGTTMVALDNPVAVEDNVYKPHYNLVMQSGTARWTGASDDHGTVVVTFPEPYGEMTLDGLVNSPVVFVQNTDDAGIIENNENIVTKTTQTATTFTLYWHSWGIARTQVDFTWFAIGVAGPIRNIQPSPSSSESPSSSSSPSSSASLSPSPSASSSPSASASPSSSVSPSTSPSVSPSSSTSPSSSVSASASPSVGPDTLIYDAFTDIDDTLLSAHTISPTNTVAASWVWNSLAWGQLVVNGNGVTGPGAGTNTYGIGIDTTVSDCIIRLSVVSLDISYGMFWIVFRSNVIELTNLANCWAIWFNEGTFHLLKYNSLGGYSIEDFCFVSNDGNYQITLTLNGNDITCAISGADEGALSTSDPDFSAYTINKLMTYNLGVYQETRLDSYIVEDLP